jgi:four helix bundle protein
LQEHAAAPDSADPDAPWLDAERLDVYRIALEFHALASTLALGRGFRELRDQLDRASTSVVLNTAEGAGRRAPADRARFFAMARGSATECAAIIDILRARSLAPAVVTGRGRSLLVRIVQMLTRLCQRLEAEATSRGARNG